MIDPFLPATLALVLILAAITLTDIRRMIIPDIWNALLGFCGVFAAALDPLKGIVWALTGMAVALAASLLLRAIYARLRGRQGLGLGDVKFFTAAGAWVGAAGLAFVALFASISGLAFVIALHLAGRPVTAASRIAFGPHLAVGLLLTWVLKPGELL
jgi:leader peptidase (prepilin peptidase) / N-methyltransferase